MQESYNGLSSEEVVASRQKNGENKLGEHKKKGFIRSFFGNLNDPIIKILIGALFLNVIISIPNVNWFESFGIAASILIATLVSTISEYSSENAFEKLRQNGGGRLAFVKRADGVSKIPEEEIVVGDIIILETGMSIGADAVIRACRMPRLGKLCTVKAILFGSGTV